MDTVAMVGRLLVSLAAVLGVMWLLARRARKGMKSKGARVIEVLDRANLSRSASVAVVRVNDQAFVLGVAESQVTILGETDLETALAAKGDAAPARKRTAPSHRTAAASRTAPAARTAPASTRRVVESAPSGHEDSDHSRVNRPLANRGATTSSPIAGSALSPQTWKQTIESLRDITARP